MTIFRGVPFALDEDFRIGLSESGDRWMTLELVSVPIVEIYMGEPLINKKCPQTFGNIRSISSRASSTNDAVPQADE